MISLESGDPPAPLGSRDHLGYYRDHLGYYRDHLGYCVVAGSVLTASDCSMGKLAC